MSRFRIRRERREREERLETEDADSLLHSVHVCVHVAGAEDDFASVAMPSLRARRAVHTEPSA